MKVRWVDIARLVIPAIVFIPGAAPLVPVILTGVNEADKIFGEDPQSETEKRQHVFNLVADGVKGVGDVGAAQIDPVRAQAVTEAVFDAIDNVKAIVKEEAEAGSQSES